MKVCVGMLLRSHRTAASLVQENIFKKALDQFRDFGNRLTGANTIPGHGKSFPVWSKWESFSEGLFNLILR